MRRGFPGGPVGGAMTWRAETRIPVVSLQRNLGVGRPFDARTERGGFIARAKSSDWDLILDQLQMDRPIGLARIPSQR